MIVLSIPPAPSGDNVEVLSWVLVALVVIIVMGAILAILALVDFDRRNEAIHREIIGDVSSLKAWARRWGDLPPEPSSDGSGGRNRLDVRLGQLEAQEAEKETTDGVEP